MHSAFKIKRAERVGVAGARLQGFPLPAIKQGQACMEIQCPPSDKLTWSEKNRQVFSSKSPSLSLKEKQQSQTRDTWAQFIKFNFANYLSEKEG